MSTPATERAGVPQTRDNEQSANKGESDRRVLMFAYLFPPCNCWPTASQRAYGLARGLTDLGWIPIVVTRELPFGGCKCGAGRPGVDDRKLIDGLEMIRVPTIRWSSLPFPNILGKFAEFVTGAYDNWAFQATRSARKYLAEDRIDLVWTTIAPISSARPGRSLRRTHELPWVADLRDSQRRRSILTVRGTGVKAWVLRKRASLLACPLRRADVVVYVAPEEARADADLIPGPARVIPSGFDEHAWAAIHRSGGSPKRDDGALTVLLAGHVEAKHSLGYSMFFDGARLYAGSAAGRNRPLRVSYLGPSFRELFEEAQRSGVAEVLIDGGVVSLEESRQAMLNADVLLLIPSATGFSSPGGKFYEYLAACRPILAVPGTDLFVEDALRRTRHGLCAQGVDAVQVALTELASGSWVAPSWPSAGLEEFTWAGRSRQLAEVFESCLERRTKRSYR